MALMITANPKTPDKNRLTATRDLVVKNTQEEWSRTPLKTHLATLDGFVVSAENEEKLGAARQWVVENMPSFLYFDDYNRLSADIYLPEFIRRIGSGDKAAETRVQQAVFKHVNAEIKE